MLSANVYELNEIINIFFTCGWNALNAMKKKKINIDGKIIILWKKEIILNEIKKYFEIIINRNLG